MWSCDIQTSPSTKPTTSKENVRLSKGMANFVRRMKETETGLEHRTEAEVGVVGGNGPIAWNARQVEREEVPVRFGAGDGETGVPSGEGGGGG